MGAWRLQGSQTGECSACTKMARISRSNSSFSFLHSTDVGLHPGEKEMQLHWQPGAQGSLWSPQCSQVALSTKIFC